MIIIGLTGTLGSGKGTVVEYLVKKHGLNHYSARDFLIEEIQRRGLPVNRDMTTLVANDLRTMHGPGYIIEELLKKALLAGKNAVIESVRTVGEIEILQKQPHFTLCVVDASPQIRYERIRKRKSQTDHVSFEKFLSDEAREMESTDPHKQNLKACMKLATHTFTNNGTIEELHSQIDKALTQTLVAQNK